MTHNSSPTTIHVASDKSLSHRALIFSALAEGVSVIHDVLTGEDVLRTLKILNQLGVVTKPLANDIFANPDVYKSSPMTVTVHGVGLHGLKSPEQDLYCGNSGTTMRLFLGLLSAQPFSSRLTGDASLDKRPMDRVILPLQNTGARFVVSEESGRRVIECLPRDAAHPVLGIRHVSKVASAQVKSCLLLSGLFAKTPTEIIEPSLSRNHSEILLQHMGVNLVCEVSETSAKIVLQPGASLQPLLFRVPGDISSAAFFLVAATLVPSSDLCLRNVNVNQTRSGVVDVLKKMGARIDVENRRNECGEPVADLRVRFARLKNMTIEKSLVPRLIDEIPILSLAGFLADGVMTVRDAKELRVKETDRIAAIAHNLQKLGANITMTDDGFVLQGCGADAAHWPKPSSVVWKTFLDHRIAMMGAMARFVLLRPTAKISGKISQSAVDLQSFELDDTACVQTSFPDFFDILEKWRI